LVIYLDGQIRSALLSRGHAFNLESALHSHHPPNKMYRATPIRFLAATAIVTVAASLIAKPASAASVVQKIDLFDTNQVVIVSGGSQAQASTSSVNITNPLLDSVTRTITVNKTTGGKSRDVQVKVDSSVNQAYFTTRGLARGSTTFDYGTFTPKDFTVGGGADSILFSIFKDQPSNNQDNQLIDKLIDVGTSLGANYWASVPFTRLFPTIAFHFTDSDGTVGTLIQPTPNDSPSGSRQRQFSLLYSDATGSGGNGILNFNAITAFSIEVDTTGAVFPNLSLNFVAVGTSGIPEPSTAIGLLALGGLGLVAKIGNRKRSRTF
jgi:hypothetical protein